MPEVGRRFSEAGSVILDGSGNGTVTLGPVPVGEVWEINRMTISIVGGNTGNEDATCHVYRNVEHFSNLVDASTTAGLDISEATQPIILGPSEHLLFVFAGGTADVAAHASAEGVR